MRILVAPDKFKNSLGAREVAEQISAGLREVLPVAEIELLPVADGGEGTADVIGAVATGVWHECEAHDPLYRTVETRFFIREDATAVLEISQAVGLWRLQRSEYDPTRTSTFGVGQMLLAAADTGVEEIIVGLGGSATNDGGAGMARALGFRFHDAKGADLADDVLELSHLVRVVPPPTRAWPRIVAACDVRNPFLGETGATHVFAAQKGAAREQMELLESALTRLADVVERGFGVDHRDVPGTGAAGGMGFGLASFCRANLRSGFEVVAEMIGLEEKIKTADIVVTGEGRLDAQSLAGKAPVEIARLARLAGKRCYAIVGQREENSELDELFDGISILSSSTADGLAETAQLLRTRGRELATTLSRSR